MYIPIRSQIQEMVFLMVRVTNHNPIDNSILYHNPLVPRAPFLYTLKKLENRKVFCFQGLEKGCIGNGWINIRQKSNIRYKIKTTNPITVIYFNHEQA